MNPIMQNLKPKNQRSYNYSNRYIDDPQYSNSDPFKIGSSKSPFVTIDSVVNKAFIMLGLVIAGAVLTWFYLGNDVNLQHAGAILTVSSIVGLVLVIVNSFKRRISPPLMIAYAAVEGLFVGSASKVISLYVDDPNIVFNAVVGTFAVAIATFLVFKFFNVRVSAKAQRVLLIALGAFLLFSISDFLLSFIGMNFGFNGFGTLGLITTIIAIGLGIFALLSDFTIIEEHIQMRSPEEYSWRLAFGLTVTLVWLYIEILRLLAITQKR